MPLYESTFIVRQDISTQEVDKIIENLTKIVSDFKGKLVKKEYWGLMNLAYKVSKNKKGHYVLFGLDSPAACINELKRQYKLSEDIIRSLTVRVEEISKEPSPLLRKAAPAPAPRKFANNEEV
jgi:small subunit ribosomal protein S6